MKKKPLHLEPIARKDDLVIQELNDEVLIYDLHRHKAHFLNQTAALVWRSCDGQTTVAEIAGKLEHEFGTPVDQQLVWLAVKQLAGSRLLKEQVIEPQEIERLSRRQLIRKLGLGAAVALPVIASINAPKALAAGSCTGTNRPPGCPCSSDNQCASNNCVGAPGGVCA